MKKTLLIILKIILILFAIIVFISMFLPVMSYEISCFDINIIFTVPGYLGTFGGKLQHHVIFVRTDYNLNIIPLIGYILPTLSIIPLYFGYKFKKKLLIILSIILCLIAVVFIYLEPMLYLYVNNITLQEGANMTVLIGPKLGVIFALVTALFNGLYISLKNKLII